MLLKFAEVPLRGGGAGLEYHIFAGAVGQKDVLHPTLQMKSRYFDARRHENGQRQNCDGPMSFLELW